jgi:hypothetical protein
MLEDVEQSPPPSTIFAMKGCSDALVDPTLLGHKDKDVGVLVALCISEIMRIVAPDAPYSDDCLKVVICLLHCGNGFLFWSIPNTHSLSLLQFLSHILKKWLLLFCCAGNFPVDCGHFQRVG